MKIVFDFDDDELNYRDVGRALKQTMTRYRELIATDHNHALLPEDSGNIWLDGSKVGTFEVLDSDDDEDEIGAGMVNCDDCGEENLSGNPCACEREDIELDATARQNARYDHDQNYLEGE